MEQQQKEIAKTRHIKAVFNYEMIYFNCGINISSSINFFLLQDVLEIWDGVESLQTFGEAVQQNEHIDEEILEASAQYGQDCPTLLHVYVLLAYVTSFI